MGRALWWNVYPFHRSWSIGPKTKQNKNNNINNNNKNKLQLYKRARATVIWLPSTFTNTVTGNTFQSYRSKTRSQLATLTKDHILEYIYYTSGGIYDLCTLLTCMPGKRHHRWLGSLLLGLCDIFRVLINSFVHWSLPKTTACDNFSGGFH